MSTPIPSLPLETHSAILECLSGDEDRESLLACSLVSHYYHKAALPLLFRKFVVYLTETPDTLTVEQSSERHWRDAASVCSFISRSSSLLRSSVQEICLVGGPGPDSRPRYVMDPGRLLDVLSSFPALQTITLASVTLSRALAAEEIGCGPADLKYIELDLEWNEADPNRTQAMNPLWRDTDPHRLEALDLFSACDVLKLANVPLGAEDNVPRRLQCRTMILMWVSDPERLVGTSETAALRPPTRGLHVDNPLQSTLQWLRKVLPHMPPTLTDLQCRGIWFGNWDFELYDFLLAVQTYPCLRTLVADFKGGSMPAWACALHFVKTLTFSRCPALEKVLLFFQIPGLPPNAPRGLLDMGREMEDALVQLAVDGRLKQLEVVMKVYDGDVDSHERILKQVFAKLDERDALTVDVVLEKRMM